MYHKSKESHYITVSSMSDIQIEHVTEMMVSNDC